MASESFVTDQSIDEHAEEKKIGHVSKYVDGEEIIFQPKETVVKEEADNSKEEGLTGMASTASVLEEKLEPGKVSVADVTKKDVQHEKVEDNENSLQESEVSSSSKPAIETNEGGLNGQADNAHETSSEGQENSSDFVETSTSQEPVILESKTKDLKDTEIKPTSEDERKPDEAPLGSSVVGISKDGNVEDEMPEAAHPESSKDKVYIELVKPEDSKDEIRVLDPAEIPAVVVPEASDVVGKIDIDSGKSTSIEVPVKDLGVESGFPEEQKSKESTETKEPSSKASTINAGSEVFGSSSYEVKPSEDAEVVGKKDDGLEVETIQASAKIQEEPEAETKLAQTESNENASQGVEVKKDVEIVESGIETSTVPSLAEVSSEEAKAFEPGVVVEEEETSLESDNFYTVPNVAEVLEDDELVGKEKVVNAEAVQRDLVDTITDPTESDVSSVQIKAPSATEIVNEALEVTSKELNIAPEASEVFSEGDQISAGDEKSENLKGEAATSVEAPSKITTAAESIDQVIEEKKTESSVSETQVLSRDKLVEKEEDVNDETKQINLLSQADGAHETLSVVQSDFAEKSASQEPAFPESKTEDLKDVEFKPTSENDRKPEEAPLVSTGVVISKDGNVEDETQEAANPEFSKDKDGIELIKLEDSKDEIQVLVSAETPSTVVVPDASEAPEKNVIDSSNFTSIEVPVKNLEVDSGSPDEQKSNEKAETKDLSSNVSAMNAGGEVVGSFSNETTPSGDVEVIEKKNCILEVETLHTSAKIHEDLEAKPELAQIHSDENISVGVEVKKDDGIAESSIERSTVPDDIPLPSVSYEEEKASEPGVVVEEEETSLEGNNIDTVPKVAEVSFEGGNALEGNKLVDKEKAMNVENVERDLVDTITDPGESEVSSVQINAPTTTETVNESLEVTSKEHDTAPEATEVPSDGDKLSAGDEKSENLNGEAATSVEAPKDISIVEEWLDQVIEVKKSENSISESRAHSEHKLIDKEEDVNEEAKEINLQSQADGAEKTQRVAQSDFSKTSTTQEPAFSESKDLEDTEIKRTSENERKQEEAPLVSTVVNISEANNVVAETKEAASLESSKNKVDIELIKSEGSKDEIQVLVPDEIQVLVPDEIPTAIVLDASEAHKKIDVDSSNLIGIEAPVDDLEIESGSSEEQISKKSTEAKETSSVVNTIDVGGEVVGSTFYEIRPSGVAEVVEKKDGGLEVETIQTSVKIQEVLDAKPELAQTHSDENVSPGVEVNNDDETIEGSIVTSTVLDVPPLAKGLSEEEKASEPGVLVVEEGVSLESDNLDTVPKVAEVSSEGSIVLEGDKLVDKEEVLNAEAVERNLIDTFTDATKSEVSSDQVKSPKTTEIVNEALEVTSQDRVAPEASEIPAEVDKISAGDEKKSESLIVGEATSVVTPKDIITVKESLDQFFEEKSESLESEMAALTEDKVADKKKNVNAEYEERDLSNASTDVIAVEVSSEQVKSPEIVEERDKQALEETSNVAPEVSEIPSADNKLSAGEEKIESLKGEAATSVETPKDITIAEESLVQVIEKEKNENLISEKEAPPEDKLVDREKNVNEEDEERDLVDTSTDPTAAEVSSDKVKPFETAKIIEEESNKQALQVTSKELNITSEASEIRSKGDEEKREGLKGEDATLVEAPKDITIAEESSDQVIEKSESSVSEKEALPENKLVDKEKNVNEEAEERDFVDTSTDLAAAEVSSDQVKFSETAEIIKEDSHKQAFKVTSKELNIPSETGEIRSKGDEVSAGDDEKKEGLKGEDATLVEAPKDITIAEEFSDQVNEKSESSVSKREALPEYKLVDKEKNVNEEAAELDLFDTSTDPTAAEVSSDQVTNSETAEIIKEESIKHASKVTSKELNITSEASEIHSKGDEVSVGDEEKREGLKGEDATLVWATKDITIAEEFPDQVIEKSESLISEKEAPLQDKLVDKEENVNVEAEKRDLVDTYTDPIAAEVSSDQIKASETAEIIKESSKQASKVTSKELNIASEAGEIPSKGDEVSAGDEEKREGLEGEDATLVEAPKDITIAEESPDQVIEISESSVSEKEALSVDKLVDKQINVNEESEERDLVNTSTDPVAGEVSFDLLKAFESAEITEESNKQALEETSKELNIASEASDVLSEGDEEKRESLNGDEDATVMDAPKDIIIAKESLDKVIEKKIEISTSEKEGPSADKLVDKEKNVKEEVEERVFVETSTNPTAAEVSSDQVKASETAEIIKEESNKQASEETSKQFNITSEAGDVPFKGDETKWESLEGEDAIVVVAPKNVIMVEETSKEFSIASEARDVPSKGDEISSGDEAKRESLEGEDATVVVIPKDVIIAEESPDQGIEKKKSESSTSEKEGPPKDKLVDKEKNVNEEAEERELVDTSADPTIAEVSSSQLQASETVDILKEASNKPALEITSKELNIASESIEVDNVSSGEEEKNESLKGEVATSLVPSNDITTEEKSIDQLIEENKNDSSKNETEAPIETTRDFDISKLFPAGVKDIIASEAVEEKQDEISNDLNVAEKKANDSEDKKEEVKITDKPEQEDLVVEKAESEKSKDQDPIVSSESGNAKLTKEVSKRESNIFSKVKRSIVKAKKAILRKSPGPKTASSQAKD